MSEATTTESKREESLYPWDLVLAKLNGGEIPEGFCANCANRRTSACPMRFSTWVGSYTTDYNVTDNTLDLGFCHMWQGKEQASER